MNSTDIPFHNVTEGALGELWKFQIWLKEAMQIILVGIVTTTIIYSFNLVIGGICIHSILKSRRKNSTKRLIFLSLYITIVLGLATAAVVQANAAISLSPGASFYYGLTLGQLDLNNIVLQRSYLADLVVPAYLVIPSYLPVMIWCADGVLLWRCFMLYQAVSRPKRWVVHAVLTLLLTASVASGIYTFAAPHIDSGGVMIDLKSASNFMLSSTIAINTIATVLIAARLLYAHRLLKASTIGCHGSQKPESPYIVAVAICVESSAMIALWAIIATITTAKSSSMWLKSQTGFPHIPGQGYTIPIVIFPQICVLSPLLIIFRVTKRRANDTVAALEENLTRNSIVFRRTLGDDIAIESIA